MAMFRCEGVYAKPEEEFTGPLPQDTMPANPENTYAGRKLQVDWLRDRVLKEGWPKGEKLIEEHPARGTRLQEALAGKLPLCFESEEQLKAFRQAIIDKFDGVKDVKVYLIGSSVKGWSMNPKKKLKFWRPPSFGEDKSDADLAVCSELIFQEHKRDKRSDDYSFIESRDFQKRESGSKFQEIADEWTETLKTKVSFKLQLDPNAGQKFRDSGAFEIIDWAWHWTSVQKVDDVVEQRNKLRADTLQKAVKSVRDDEEMDLKFANLRDDGAEALAERIPKTTRLTTFRLNCCNIGLDGLKALADAFAKNTSLRVVWLRDSNIGNVESKALAEALKTNNTLRELVFRQNNIGDEGAKAVAKVLATNTTLTSLDMSRNNIGAEGAKAIGTALSSNSALTWLNLEFNLIGDAGAQALKEAWAPRPMYHCDRRTGEICGLFL